MKYACVITFSWLLSISSEAAKMTPGQPEGCAFCPAFQHEYLSLFPCVTNKAELPPHSLVNRHRSCRAKGRRGGGGAAKQTRQKQDDVPGRNTRVSVTPPVGPLMTAGGIPGVHPSERSRRTAGKNQTCQPGTKSSCLDKEQPPPPQIRQTPPFLSFLRTQRRSQRSQPPHPSSVAFLLAGIGPADCCGVCPPLTTQRDCASSRRCDAMRCAAPLRLVAPDG